MKTLMETTIKIIILMIAMKKLWKKTVVKYTITILVIMILIIVMPVITIIQL